MRSDLRLPKALPVAKEQSVLMLSCGSVCYCNLPACAIDKDNSFAFTTTQPSHVNRRKKRKSEKGDMSRKGMLWYQYVKNMGLGREATTIKSTSFLFPGCDGIVHK